MDLDRLLGFLRQDPDNLALLATVSDALIEAGDAEAASTHVHRALEIAPGNDEFQYRRAVVLRRTGKIAVARAQLEELLRRGTAAPAVRYQLAELEFGERDFESSVRLLKLLTPVERQNTANADLLLVRALHHLGLIDEAIEVAEAAARESASNLALVGALATLYLDAERLADAARLISAAKEHGDSSPELQCVSGYLALASEQPKAAAELFEETLRTRPRDGRALLGAGLSSAAEGELANAAEYLRAASAAMPGHLGTLNALAWMQLLSGRLDDAAEILKRAQTVDNTFAETHGGLAVIAAIRGDRELAQSLIRTALKLDRASFSAAYAAMLLEHGAATPQTLSAALEFLSRQSAPGGGTMKSAVLRFASGATRFRNPRK